MGAVPSAEHRHARQALIAWQFVRIAGPSMVPTLRPGEFAIVHRRGRVRVGDVVTATFDDLPGRVVVKRLRALRGRTESVGSFGPPGIVATLAVQHGIRADLRSDNDAAGGDSRTHGLGRVQGRVVVVGRGWRWRRPGPTPAAQAQR